MAVTGIISSASKAGTAGKLLKKLGLGSAVTAGICLFDFAKVPDAFNLKYNKKGEKVEGTNWKCGTNEILKSLPKCAQAIIVPTLITAAAAGASPVVATLAGVAALAAPIGGYSLLDKLFPHEDEEVKLICQEKGIDINNSQGVLA